MYVNEIIARRPMVSKRRPSRTGPRKLPTANGSRYSRRVARHVVEVGQDERVGEEDGVVQKRLRHHSVRPSTVRRRCCGDRRDHCAKPTVLVCFTSIVPSGSGRSPSMYSRPLLDVGDDAPRPRRRGRGSSASAGSRAGTGGSGALPGRGPRRCRSPRASPCHGEVRRLGGDGGRRADRRAHPVGAVDGQVRPAAHPGGDELVDGGVDGRVLAADAGAGEEPRRSRRSRSYR